MNSEGVGSLFAKGIVVADITIFFKKLEQGMNYD